MSLAVSFLAIGATAVSPMQHGWDTVGEMMGMHGKWDPSKTSPAQVIQGIEWAAKHYAVITTGTSCKGNHETSEQETVPLRGFVGPTL